MDWTLNLSLIWTETECNTGEYTALPLIVNIHIITIRRPKVLIFQC